MKIIKLGKKPKNSCKFWSKRNFFDIIFGKMMYNFDCMCAQFICPTEDLRATIHSMLQWCLMRHGNNMCMSAHAHAHVQEAYLCRGCTITYTLLQWWLVGHGYGGWNVGNWDSAHWLVDTCHVTQIRSVTRLVHGGHMTEIWRLTGSKWVLWAL